MPAPAPPFRGHFGPPADLSYLAARNIAGDSAPLLDALFQDPHFVELDRDLRLADVLVLARRRPFDIDAFLDRGRRAIAAYVRRAHPALSLAFTRDPSNIHVILEQKLLALGQALLQAGVPQNPLTPLTPSRAVTDLFRRLSYVVPLTRVRGATLLYSGTAAAGVVRYAWRLSTPGDPPSRAAATARAEVGGSVFVDDVDVDPRTGVLRRARATRRAGQIRTQVIVKGVGPTRYANNRFSRRSSGASTWPQGERDWHHSEALARGGVPVYRPLELTLLPYFDWHPVLGWRPWTIYARLPLENLRVSDLEVLPRTRAREAIREVRSKVAALSGDPARALTDADLVCFFVARMGRIAGLCEGGRTFDGRPFFHSYLHAQNVSLLGELVNVGDGRFVRDRRELRATYAASAYVKPGRNWTPAIRRAGREAALFHQIARRFTRLVTRIMASFPACPPRGLDVLFWRSHRDGLAGLRADRVDDLLEIVFALQRR